MNAKIIFIGAAVSTGLVWAVSSLLTKKKVGDKLDTNTKVMVHTLDLKGLTLRIDVNLINPTEGTLTIKQPYVKILFNKKDVGTTQIENKIVEIPSYNSKQLEPIYLTIPATGLFSLGEGLLSVMLKKKPAQITVKIMSSINIAGIYKSVETSQNIALNPKKAK